MVAQHSCLILRHFLECSLRYIKGPFRDFHFISESVFFLYSSQSPLFRARQPCFIILCVQSVSLKHFKYSLAGNSCCHWPCIPARLSFSNSSRNLFTLALSWQKYSHISRTCCSIPIIFQSLPRCVFCSANSLHCTFVSGFFPFASRGLLQHHWHKLVSLSPPTPTARS